MDDDHEIDNNDDDGEVQGKGDGCPPPKRQVLQPESNDIASYVGHSQSRPLTLSSAINCSRIILHLEPTIAFLKLQMVVHSSISGYFDFLGLGIAN